MISNRFVLLDRILHNLIILTLGMGLIAQERKRPRKLSHKVLECTIEEVSVAPTKKKVCCD